MASYSEINAVSMRNTLNNLKNSLNYSASSEAKNTLSGNGYWQCDCKQIFINALSGQIDTNYKKLNDKIDDYLLITNYIEEWQRLNNEMAGLYSSRDNANGKILEKKWYYKTNAYGKYVYDDYGNKIKVYYNGKNSYWEGQYNYYVRRINENNSAMSELDNKISNLI